MSGGKGEGGVLDLMDIFSSGAGDDLTMAEMMVNSLYWRRLLLKRECSEKARVESYRSAIDNMNKNNGTDDDSTASEGVSPVGRV